MSAEQVALDHYRQRKGLVDAAAQVAAQAWRQVAPDNIATSWAAQVPELNLAVTGAQQAAAQTADGYLDEVLAEQGLDPTAVGRVNPRALSGIASDGRNLASLLYQPAITALVGIQSGAAAGEAMASGLATVDMIARTQVADAGRVADGVALNLRPAAHGYVRMVVGKTCSRCIILAGRFYATNTGFQRHPRCDCIHVPAAEDLRTNPRAVFDSMPAAEQDRVFTKAGAQAIRGGADMSKVVNARRGMTTAGGRRLTTEAAGRGRTRLMPEQIYRDAGSREEVLRLLRTNGYILDRQVIRRDFDLAASTRGPARATKAKARAVQIRPELRQARTASAISKVLEDEARKITGRRIPMKLEGGAETAREHAEGLLRVLERFPKMSLNRVSTNLLGTGPTSYAEARFDVGTIAFGQKWGMAARREEYLAALRSDAEWEGIQFGKLVSFNGYHPRNTDTPMAVAIHEAGHIVDLHDHQLRDEISTLVHKRAAEEGIAASEMLSRDISRYAAKNEHELIAEAFTDVMVNGDAASQLSRDVFTLIEKSYRRRVGA